MKKRLLHIVLFLWFVSGLQAQQAQTDTSLNFEFDNFILLGISDFPLEVAIQPDTASGTDQIHNAKYEAMLYENIVVNNKPKPVTNISLKQGDILPLKTLVSRMEIDSIEKTITLSNGKNFNQRLSTSG